MLMFPSKNCAAAALLDRRSLLKRVQALNNKPELIVYRCNSSIAHLPQNVLNFCASRARAIRRVYLILSDYTWLTRLVFYTVVYYKSVPDLFSCAIYCKFYGTNNTDVTEHRKPLRSFGQNRRAFISEKVDDGVKSAVDEMCCLGNNALNNTHLFLINLIIIMDKLYMCASVCLFTSVLIFLGFFPYCKFRLFYLLAFALVVLKKLNFIS